jgi:hypothetical protein
MVNSVFPGDSELAQRMRAFDWSTTTLGPVERWPAALRTSVSIALHCAFPYFVQAVALLERATRQKLSSIADYSPAASR